MKSKMTSKGRAMTAAVCALSCALIILGTFIKIPLPMISITLQLEFVLLSAMLLGAWRSSLSVAAYIILGLCGVPVFTYGGGIACVLKPSFGFISCLRVASVGIGYEIPKRDWSSDVCSSDLLRRARGHCDNIYYRYCIFLFCHPIVSQYISGLHEDDERLRVHDLSEGCRFLPAARVHSKARLSRHKKVYHLLTIE